FSICRSSSNPFHPAKFETIARRAKRSAIGCRRWYGVILRETNFIREQNKQGEQLGPLSNKENQLSEAIEAALDKKAQDPVVIELGEICSFTDYFLICTGTSTRQNQTIAEHIEETLKKQGVRPL